MDDEAEYSSSEVNSKLLAAVSGGDSWTISKLLQDYAGEWLDGEECRSQEPSVNAALAALMSPLGPECIEAFDIHFGDLRNWHFGRWPVIHWAVAQKSEWAVEWALKGHRSEGPWKSSPLLELEDTDHDASRARRSALALCAQMGDVDWLVKVLGLGEDKGYSMEALAKGDARCSPPATSLALFELASQSRDGASQESLAGLEACARFLSSKGFGIPTEGAGSAKLCVALALSDPGRAGNCAMGKAARLASELAGGCGPCQSAGLAMDAQWLEALELCGVFESKEDCFGVGVGQAILLACTEASPGGESGHGWRSNRAVRNRLSKLAQASFDNCGIAASARPLGGAEIECLSFWNADARERKSRWPSFVEKTKLAAIAGVGSTVKADRFRL